MSIAEKIVEVIERTILTVIAVLTVVVIFQEVQTILGSGTVKLADLFPMFLYLEAVGLLVALYRFRRIPISIPTTALFFPFHATRKTTSYLHKWAPHNK